MKDLPRLEDDGLYTPEVNSYAQVKYRLVSTIADIFAAGMKNKWHARVYLDLYAGAGRSKLKRHRAIVPTPGAVALGLPVPFDRYVFCDKNPECMSAFEKRAKLIAPSAAATFLPIDVNERPQDILGVLPQPHRGNRVLTLCIVDPFGMAFLHFATLRVLSARIMDFLVLIPSHFDANRNEAKHVRPQSRVVADFLGDPEWREAWSVEHAKGVGFGDFVIAHFCRQMQTLGFLPTDRSEMERIEYPIKRTPMYHLAYFSKNPLGMKFWYQARKYADPQGGLFG